MNKALLDKTSLWKIRPEEQVIPDINSLQVDNAREQAKLYYEANKEEIWANTLREKDKEINRLNNIINELEKWLETKREEYATNIEWLSTTRMSNVLDKLKELKENNKK